MSPDLCQKLAAWACNYALPHPQRQAIRLLVRDFVGCVIAGNQRAELNAALRLARTGTFGLWGRAESVDGPSAALLLGTSGSLLQLHDLYVPALVHPSCTVMAAALAARHGQAVTHDEFIRAVAVGYEVCNHSAAVLRGGVRQTVLTAVAGSLGATVAAALVRGGDREAIARALSILPMLMPIPPAAAVRSHAEVVPLHGGLAARAAIEAVLLADELPHTQRVMEGDQVIAGYLTLLGISAAELAPERWQTSTLDAVIGKQHPACFGAYAAVEAVLHHASSLSSVQRLRIGLPARLLPIIDSGPNSGLLYDRVMSVRWVIARLLQPGKRTMHDVDGDEATLNGAQCIELYHQPEFDAEPASFMVAELTWEGAHGREQRRWRRDVLTDSNAITTMTLQHPTAWHSKFAQLAAAWPAANDLISELIGER